MIQNYRNNDPPTSVIAGKQITASGTRKRHRLMCLNAVNQTPGLTAREIEARIGIKAHKRLPELRASQVVCNGPPRHCSITGRLAMTWWPFGWHF